LPCQNRKNGHSNTYVPSKEHHNLPFCLASPKGGLWVNIQIHMYLVKSTTIFLFAWLSPEGAYVCRYFLTADLYYCTRRATWQLRDCKTDGRLQRKHL
jgi:hypothetical protein